MDYMADKVQSGKVSHVIEGVGDPCTKSGRCAVGNYLSGFEGRVPDHLDLDTGAGIIIDRTGSSPVVVILKSWDVHAYHATEEYIERRVGFGRWE